MAKAFVGIMLVVNAKSGKEIYWLTKMEGVTNNTLSNTSCNKKGFNCFLERLVTLSSVYLAQRGNKLNTWNSPCGETTVTTCITAITGSWTDP